MKKKFLLLLSSLIAICGLHAQLDLGTPAETKALPALAQSLTDFTKAIRPSAFISAFVKEKPRFMSMASTVSTPAELGKSLSRLVVFLKPGKLKPAFKSADFMKATSHTTTMEGAKGSLKDLENNLKPASMADIWKIQRNGWLNTLNDIH